MAALTAREREVLLANRHLPGVYGEADIAGIAFQVADSIRGNLEGVADLDIARTLLQVAANLAGLSNELERDPGAWNRVPPHVLVMNIGAVFGIAAAEFASLELEAPAEGS